MLVEAVTVRAQSFAPRHMREGFGIESQKAGAMGIRLDLSRPFRHVDATVRVDADEIAIVSRVVDSAQRKTVADFGSARFLRIRDDVRRFEKLCVREVADGAGDFICADDVLAKIVLVDAGFGPTRRVPSFDQRRIGVLNGGRFWFFDGDDELRTLSVDPFDEGREADVLVQKGVRRFDADEPGERVTAVGGFDHRVVRPVLAGRVGELVAKQAVVVDPVGVRCVSAGSWRCGFEGQGGGEARGLPDPLCLMNEREAMAVPHESAHELLMREEFVPVLLLRLEPLHRGEVGVELLIGSEQRVFHFGR